MTSTTYAIMIYRDEERLMSLDEVARAAGLHPELVERLLDHGIIEAAERVGESVYFDCSVVPRLFAVDRLRRDVGANVASAAIILDLVDRIRNLERDLARLRLVREDPRG